MRILVIPCDGIGPEIVGSSVAVLEAANKKFGLGLTFDHEEAGFVSLKKYGITLRDDVLEKAKGYDGIILGTQSHADYPTPERGGATSRPSSVLGLISTPTCGQPARVLSCART